MRIERLQVKLWLIRKLELAGLHIEPMRRYRPVEARDHAGNPLKLSYRHPGRRLLIDAPAAWGYGLYSYPPNRPHPLIPAMQKAFDQPGLERVCIRHALQQFYAEWQPATAAEFFGLDAHEARALAEQPAWLSPWPWEPLSLEEKHAQRKRTERRETARVLGRGLDVATEGWKFCGPVTVDKLEVEVERLASVLESIRAQGLRRHDGIDGDIRALVLSHPDGRWRWQVLGGQHRYAVVTALEKEFITIRVEQFVRREEVALWPQVASGLFEPAAALKIFDALFDAQPASEKPSCRTQQERVG